MRPQSSPVGGKRPVHRLSGVLALAAAALAPVVARAHGGEDLSAHDVWSAWNLTLVISGPILLVLATYVRGAIRRRSVSQPVSVSRHALFMTGMLAFFLSLQSPIDPMGERLFLAHQIQHLLLRMIGPMLIVLSRPQGVLIAGLPEALRKSIVAPVMASSTMSGLYRHLTRPVMAFVLFVLSLYVWQVPAIHNLALLNSPIHWAMHLTMLAAGFVFFAMVFERRDVPASAPYVLRIVLLLASILTNIILGALTVFKSTVLYTAYDIEGRLFDIAPLSDETAGGFILWVPASMMTIIAIMIVIYDWNRTEDTRLRRGLDMSGPKLAATDAPGSGTANRARMVASNKRLGLLLGLAAPTMFGLAVGLAVFLVSLG